MHVTTNEKFQETLIDGTTMFMTLHSLDGNVEKVSFHSLEENYFFLNPARCGCPKEGLMRVFEFLRSYACLLSTCELIRGWRSYERAKSQNLDFWDCFETA
ncbi:hypothetical protein [Vibrio barjaei]|uniref:hypothetical protein n=1 Tax=Vibrio barjaei TaxID=1676683 RepID=UPI002284DF1F|nr:hypothetical protein [Vibrio barjaei]MCY9873858.1 hypothetical protein [Vibrio barjaei]